MANLANFIIVDLGIKRIGKTSSGLIQNRARLCKIMTNDQALSNNNNLAYLKRCQLLVSEKLNWPLPGEWRNYEFAELSDKIFDTTGVQLSVSTLKRIFGKVKYNNLPSSATLNTLAQYLGYTSWMEFRSNEKMEAEERIGIKEKRSYTISKKLLLATGVAVFLFVILGFILLTEKRSSAAINTESTMFRSRSLADGLPNTVVFNFDLKGITSNDIIIQQSWDSTKTIRVSQGQTEATGMYYMPGYFRAKLIVDGKIIKEHDLFIPSNMWVATIDHTPVPTYLTKEELILNDHLSVSASAMNEIKKIDKPVTLTYHLVKRFDDLQTDNFTLETRVQNIYHEGPAVCETSKIFILGTKGAFIIPLSIPGCVGDINLKLNDKVLPGRSNDLSMFGADLSEWVNVKLVVKNRKATIFLNDTIIREEGYNSDAGDVVGLRYSFLGAGMVDHIRLTNNKGEIKYEEKFR